MASWVNVFQSVISVVVNKLTFLTEYWLASLKVITIVIFIILGILVNVGVNHEHRYIGGSYWRIPGAPFVGGFGGLARVFVTASFACMYWDNQPLSKNSTLFSGLLSTCAELRFLTLYRRWYGELGYHSRRNKKPFSKHAKGGKICILAVCKSSRHPSNMISNVYRILLFYILSVLLIGLNGAYHLPLCGDSRV